VPSCQRVPTRITNNSYFADPWQFNCKNDPALRAICTRLTSFPIFLAGCLILDRRRGRYVTPLVFVDETYIKSLGS
jgi:hypothetical protein